MKIGVKISDKQIRQYRIPIFIVFKDIKISTLYKLIKQISRYLSDVWTRTALHDELAKEKRLKLDIKKFDPEKIIEEILAADEAMRYVAIITGMDIIFNKMKKGKTSLKSVEQETRFAADLSIMNDMQKVFDEPLGKVSQIHIVRKKVHQLVYLIGNLVIYVTCERNIADRKVQEISSKVEQKIRSFFHLCLDDAV